MSAVLVFLTLLSVLVVTAYLYVNYAYSYWKRRGVPYIQPKFPFGNFKKMFFKERSLPEMLRELYNTTTEPVIGMYTLLSPTLLVRDPKVIRDVLVKDFNVFHHRGFMADPKVDPMSGNLFVINGDKWKSNRAKFSPAFTTGKLKGMFDTIRDCCGVLDNHVAPYAKSGEIVEIREVFARFATNVIASVVFGIEVNCIENPNANFRKYGRRFFDATMLNMFRFNLCMLTPRLAQWLRFRFTDKDVGEFMIETVRKNLEYREKNNVVRKDLFQMLMQLRNTGVIREDDWSAKASNDKKLLTLEEMSAEAFIFFIGGFESASTTMSFCLYEMCKNQEVQRKAFEEISTVLENHDGQLTYESLAEMSYMEHCIDETLRLHPPFGAVSRQCTQDYKIADTNIVIEKGTNIMIPISSVQRDPKYYEDVDTFIPERFDDSVMAKKTFLEMPYLPFGFGPRICIAYRLAKLQAKLTIVLLLQKYHFDLSEFHKSGEMKIDARSSAKMPVGGINLYVSSR